MQSHARSNTQPNKVPPYEQLPKIRFANLNETLRCDLGSEDKTTKWVATKMVAIVCYDRGTLPIHVTTEDLMTARVESCILNYKENWNSIERFARKVYRVLGNNELLPQRNRKYKNIHPLVTEWLNTESFEGVPKVSARCVCMRFLTWLSDVHLVSRRPENIPVTYLQRRHLQEYRLHLLHRVRQKVYTQTAAKVYLQYVLRWLRWLIKQRYTGSIDTTGLSIRDSDSRVKRVPSHIELCLFFKVITELDTAESYFICFLLQLATGARPIEIRKLKMADLDLEHRQVRLQSKRGPERWVSIGTNLVKLLHNYLARQPHREPSDCMLQGATGHSLSTGVIWRHFNDARKISGIDINGPMVFRHRFATDCYEKGVPINVVQYLLGHKTLSEMSRYQHTTDSLTFEQIESSLNNWRVNL